MWKGKLPELLSTGYFVVTGRNNSGKSNLIYELFKQSKKDRNKRVYIPASRDGSVVSTSFGSWDLEKLNREIAEGEIFGNRETVATILPFYKQQLFQSLYTTGDNKKLIKDLNQNLKRLGFGMLKSLEVHNGNKTTPAMQSLDDNQREPIYAVGYGFNSIILCLQAALNPHVEEVYIDEPDVGLEPEKQKILRDILLEQGAKKRIVIATHSHLMLNTEPSSVCNNYQMKPTLEVDENYRGKGATVLTPVKCETRSDLAEVVYKLLGNSLSDLMLPHNYAIVEGPSDQVITETVAKLMSCDMSKVVVIAAGGITEANKKIEAVKNQVLPNVIGHNPYSKTVTCLLDKPGSEKEGKVVRKVKDSLGDRAFVLPASSLEASLPEELYERAGLGEKQVILDEAAKLKGNYDQLKALKKRVSTSISGVLNEDDLGLPGVKVISDFVEKTFASVK